MWGVVLTCCQHAAERENSGWLLVEYRSLKQARIEIGEVKESLNRAFDGLTCTGSLRMSVKFRFFPTYLPLGAFENLTVKTAQFTINLHY
jgi:hypothetical protein